MPKETIRFDPNGDALSVELTCVHAQDGVYNLYLWAPDSNRPIWERSGDFESSADDRYTLPGSAAEQGGRKAHASMRVILIPPETKYEVRLTVRQGDEDIGVVTASGDSTQSTVPLDLVARLEANGS